MTNQPFIFPSSPYCGSPGELVVDSQTASLSVRHDGVPSNRLLTVSAPVTFHVPGDFATLADAINALKSASIGARVDVILTGADSSEILDGSPFMNKAIVIENADLSNVYFSALQEKETASCMVDPGRGAKPVMMPKPYVVSVQSVTNDPSVATFSETTVDGSMKIKLWCGITDPSASWSSMFSVPTAASMLNIDFYVSIPGYWTTTGFGAANSSGVKDIGIFWSGNPTTFANATAAFNTGLTDYIASLQTGNPTMAAQLEALPPITIALDGTGYLVFDFSSWVAFFSGKDPTSFVAIGVNGNYEHSALQGVYQFANGTYHYADGFNTASFLKVTPNKVASVTWNTPTYPIATVTVAVVLEDSVFSTPPTTSDMFALFLNDGGTGIHLNGAWKVASYIPASGGNKPIVHLTVPVGVVGSYIPINDLSSVKGVCVKYSGYYTKTIYLKNSKIGGWSIPLISETERATTFTATRSTIFSGDIISCTHNGTSTVNLSDCNLNINYFMCSNLFAKSSFTITSVTILNTKIECASMTFPCFSQILINNSKIYVFGLTFDGYINDQSGTPTLTTKIPVQWFYVPFSVVVPMMGPMNLPYVPSFVAQQDVLSIKGDTFINIGDLGGFTGNTGATVVGNIWASKGAKFYAPSNSATNVTLVTGSTSPGLNIIGNGDSLISTTN